MPIRQIERLLARAGRNNELTYCECFLGDEDYSYYVKPLTPAQYDASHKANRKGDKPSELEAAVRLFMVRALDAEGVRQYQEDAFNILMRMSFDDLTKLIGAAAEEEGGNEELDIKSLGEATEKGKLSDGGVSGSGKTRKNTD